MVYAVLLAHFFCVVQSDGAVAVCDDEDVFFWEYLLCSYERGADDVCGFVLAFRPQTEKNIQRSLLETVPEMLPESEA